MTTFAKAKKKRKRQNTYLSVELNVGLNFGNNKSNNDSIIDGGQRIKPGTGGNVFVPRIRIIHGKPVLAQFSNLIDVGGTEKP